MVFKMSEKYEAKEITAYKCTYCYKIHEMKHRAEECLASHLLYDRIYEDFNRNGMNLGQIYEKYGDNFSLSNKWKQLTEKQKAITHNSYFEVYHYCLNHKKHWHVAEINEYGIITVAGGGSYGYYSSKMDVDKLPEEYAEGEQK